MLGTGNGQDEIKENKKEKGGEFSVEKTKQQTKVLFW